MEISVMMEKNSVELQINQHQSMGLLKRKTKAWWCQSSPGYVRTHRPRMSLIMNMKARRRVDGEEHLRLFSANQSSELAAKTFLIRNQDARERFAIENELSSFDDFKWGWAAQPINPILKIFEFGFKGDDEPSENKLIFFRDAREWN